MGVLHPNGYLLYAGHTVLIAVETKKVLAVRLQRAMSLKVGLYLFLYYSPSL